MKLIFSQNFDPSTDFVIEWLNSLGKPFYRINYNTDKIESVFLELENEPNPSDLERKEDVYKYVKSFTFRLKNGTVIDLKKVTAVWYRRGGMPDFDYSFLDFSVLKTKFFISESKKYVRTEYTEIVKYIYYFLFSNPNITTIGHPGLTTSNKLTYLTMARLQGFKIPDFYIVSDKQKFKYVLSKAKYMITKGISEMVMFAQDYVKLVSYTKNIDTNDLDRMENRFFPSGMQKKVIKIADIRVVYFNSEIHSMAIFSQNNPKTDTDFRNYDNVNPNRNTPFKLPDEIEVKIRSLCKQLRINFCSMDILLDQNYDFYFLEINPVGQFGMTSLPCNYYIEKKIAEFL